MKGPAQTPPSRCKARKRFTRRRDGRKVQGVVRCRVNVWNHEKYPELRHHGTINWETVRWA